MKHSDKPPVYSQVAFDIAAKIAVGELKEGDRFSGRSLMSSQYGVSPETIRRALGHLSYLGIVATKITADLRFSPSSGLQSTWSSTRRTGTCWR